MIDLRSGELEGFDGIVADMREPESKYLMRLSNVAKQICAAISELAARNAMNKPTANKKTSFSLL